MRRLKRWVKDFFGFSRAETNAFLVLIPLMMVLIFSEPVYRYWTLRQPRDYSRENHRLDSILAAMEWPNEKPAPKTGPTTSELFPFDPNFTTLSEFTLLGFSQTLAKRIINYRTKGGRFITKSDLKKIYGMDSIFFKKLLPFIRLPEFTAKPSTKPRSEAKQELVIAKFDLNTADTSQFIKIYGIGRKLAHRIISYRTKLGGFVFGSQLHEVYGLDSVVVRELLEKAFVSENFQPRLLNINVAQEMELASHPYIKYKFAKAIVAYRKQHGVFGSLDDLKKIAIIGEFDWQKMRPYLVTE